MCEALRDSYFAPLSLKERLLYRLYPQALLRRLESAVEEAQKRLLNYEKTHPESEGFGTILSALVIKDRRRNLPDFQA